MSIDQLSIADISSLGFSNHRLAKASELYVDKTLGSSDVTNHVYGINHRQTPLAVPMNKDQYGLCFFTRPQLNLQSENLRQKRFMHPLLDTNPISYYRLIRCTLDPRLMTGYGDDDVNSNENVDAISCPIVDNQSAFIPVLTNSLTSISGWPDMKLPIAQSQEGKYKESHIMVDGVTEDYSAYTLNASFRNSRASLCDDFQVDGVGYKRISGAKMEKVEDCENGLATYKLDLQPTNNYLQAASVGVSYPILHDMFNSKIIINDCKIIA